MHLIFFDNREINSQVLEAAKGIEFVCILFSLDSPGRDPKHPRRGDGINSPSLPPGDFVAEAMVVAVMRPAQRYREFVADLAPQGTRLHKLDVMGIGRTPAADKARLRAHEIPMRFIAFSDRLYDRDPVLIILCQRGV